MAEKIQRDWIDLIAKLLIPVVIAACGIVFTLQKDKTDRNRQESDHKSDVARQQLERDTGYVRMLASTNEKERALGFKIIEVQQSHGNFSQDLLPVLQAISQERPSATSTQKAKTILQTAVKQNPEIATRIAEQTSAQVPTVYLQIARAEQRAEAIELQTKLRATGFAVEDIDLPSGPTVNTYVRYFSEAGKGNADKVFEIMKTMGFDVKEQIADVGKAPPDQLEVWIGQRQGLLPTQ